MPSPRTPPKIGAIRHHACGCISQYAFWDRTQPDTALWDTRIMCRIHATSEYRARINEEATS